MRRKLAALRGRQKAFWLPSFNNALALAAPVAGGAVSIVVREIGLQIAYADDALDIFMRLNDGTTIARQVTTITPGAGVETLGLASAMPRAVTQADVASFSTLHRMRLAQDRIEWLHRPAVGPKVVVAAQEAPVPA